MRRLYSIVAFALALLLMPAVVPAQPAGCTWEGDPSFRYGFGALQIPAIPFHQPGNDFADIYAGQTLTYKLAPCNSAANWLPAGCKALDTLCFHAVSLQGWTIATNPPMGDLYELLSGYIWYQNVSITAPCDASLGDKDTLIAIACYANNAGVCDPTCGDCKDPNVRPADGLKYYSKDTLILTVVAAPPALGVLQDTLTIVGRWQTQAYVPFSICNADNCAPLTEFIYNIRSLGHVGPAINTTDTVMVDGGTCKDVYGVINAGSSLACAYDTLTIVVWSSAEPVVYDTCVQVVHVVESCCVPVFTPAVAAILVLALLLAAAVFMRKRSARRA